MGTEFVLNQDLTSPDGAQVHCRELARRAVDLTVVRAKTKDAAIFSLSRRYRFGSWLGKLHRGQKVTLHLHLYERLCRAVEDAARELERQVEHDQALIEQIRGKHAAISNAALAGSVAPASGAAPARVDEPASLVGEAA